MSDITIKIKAFTSYGSVPSYDCKRIHLANTLEFDCPRCKNLIISGGTDFLYVPSEYPVRGFYCDKCEFESNFIELVDIHENGDCEFKKYKSFDFPINIVENKKIIKTF